MTAVLVDTSVWVAHFQTPNAALVDLLGRGKVLGHPLVIGEIACGTPPKRTLTLQALADLKSVRPATHPEVLALIEREKLFGHGCGLVDLSLLAAVLHAPPVLLWTSDKKLHALARKFSAAFTPAHH